MRRAYRIARELLEMAAVLILVFIVWIIYMSWTLVQLAIIIIGIICTVSAVTSGILMTGC